MPRLQTINVPIRVELSGVQTEEIVHNYLEELADGRWIQEGKLMDEAYTSHRFDVVVTADPDDPEFRLVEAVRNLQAILNERKKR